MQSIVLASRSPRRKQLLEWARIPFEIIEETTDEYFPPGMNTNDIPVFIAKNKALAVRNSAIFKRYEQGHPILAADTVVCVDNDIIGKPKDREEAVEMLSRLSGKTHLVITGVAFLYNGREHSFSETTAVTFYDLSPADIAFYIDNYHPYDKAGAYAIQEWIGVTGIKSIQGDFYNVMGLPISRVVKLLAEIRK